MAREILPRAAAAAQPGFLDPAARPRRRSAVVELLPGLRGHDVATGRAA